MTKRTPTPFTQSWLPVLIWMGLIFCLSSIPGPKFPDLLVPSLSGIAHFIEYSILGALMIRAFDRSMPNQKILVLAIATIILSFLFALSDEWHQSFVPGRFCQLEDIIVDAFSIILGVLWFIRKREQGAADTEPTAS